MEITRELAKSAVENVFKEYKGFSSLEVGSKEYATKGVAIETHVVALARLHPRWSAEEEEITNWTQETAHLIEEEEENSLFVVFERTEDLFWYWRNMKASRPSADSLRKWIPLFAENLAALCEETEATFTV